MDKKVSIVISVFNEETNLIKLYEEIINCINNISTCDFEIIFVNDGSYDHSFDILMNLYFKDERVKVVNFTRNFGHEIAMTAGMDYAIGDCVIFMDADLQHPPKVIDKMVQFWIDGTDVVLTNRIENKEQSLFRKFMNASFNIVFNLLSDTKIPANTPDFRLIDRKYIDQLKKMNERNRMFRGLLLWLGIPNHQTIDFVAEKRFGGKTKYNFIKSVNLAINTIIQFSIKPLRLASLFGFLTMLVAIALGIFSLWEYFIKGLSISEFRTLVIFIFVLSALQYFVIGIFGEYLGKIHQESKKRPLYVANYYSTEAKEDLMPEGLNRYK